MSYNTNAKTKKLETFNNFNKMSKNSKKLPQRVTRTKLGRAGLLLILGVAVAGITISLAPTSWVYADKYQDQINDLNQQNAAKQDGLNALGSQAASLQDAINKLQAEISNLQTQIQSNETQRVATVAKITNAQAQLVHNKQMLSDILKSMYVGEGMSSLEMLATSKNLNDYVDQQQYNNSVQSQIQTTLSTIKTLQAQLDTQKSNLERIIADQTDMKAKTAAQQGEQSRLLSLNQSQQAELDGQIKANASKITDLQKQQALENARLSGGKIPAGSKGGGGYPGVWAFATQDSILDSWGMYNRECVSYTAYRVAASGRYMPYWGGYGNANQWDDNARAAGIPVDNKPRTNDVAISNSGSYGHALYVEAVASDGSINVSDYNQQYDGLYRNYWIGADTVASKGLVFIHF